MTKRLCFDIVLQTMDTLSRRQEQTPAISDTGALEVSEGHEVIPDDVSEDQHVSAPAEQEGKRNSQLIAGERLGAWVLSGREPQNVRPHQR